VRKALLVVFLLLAGCGAEQSDFAEELERVKRSSMGPVYWLGSSFEGLPLTDIVEGPRGPFFVYGECMGEQSGDSFHCTGAQVRYPKLTIEVTPVADRSPAGWRAVRKGMMRCDRLRIRGAEAALLPSAHELYVFTGQVTALLRGNDLPLLRRAADALRPFAAAAMPERLLPPSEELRAELRRVCGA
jgi:hypothetical protein